jgi:hypothetical protein
MVSINSGLVKPLVDWLEGSCSPQKKWRTCYQNGISSSPGAFYINCQRESLWLLPSGKHCNFFSPLGALSVSTLKCRISQGKDHKKIYSVIPPGYDYNSSPWYRWPIEIDGLPNLKMVDLSMAITSQMWCLALTLSHPSILGFRWSLGERDGCRTGWGCIPSGKRLPNELENHNVSWVNP